MDVRERAQELYRVALDDATWRRETVTGQYGWSDTEFAEALQLLSRLRLFVPAPDNRNGWTALSPDTALRNLLTEEERNTAALLHSVQQTRSAFTRILADFQPVHARELLSVRMEVVTGAANVSAALENVARRVEEEVLSLHPGRALPAEMVEAGLERDLAALGRGVRVRTVHLGAAAAVPHMASYLRRLSAAGAQVRTAHTLPLRLIVVDRSTAIVPAPPAGEDGIAAVILRGETLVGVFREIFEHCWEAANALSDVPAGPDGEWRPEGRHREVLRMLAGGLTDEAMARKLGVSERTVRRLVSELTERLGAASRFQAGASAVRLGWLDS
ncbi:erythropoiesis-stimulating protein [Streptomyces spinoverrucosus]|uniref:helix-turn-helix transcriptional regulator n=1 Tax=Streptomyces spinoverrucosus TaxID=284043 RepID=UPI0018C35FBB|nr:LuxR C-terminal-related transcriptional regulator [Streptomyces spinoverrucosus]MBG0854759.1 erythropoiesis-stimulating protein [Streptomyces spinoverrucosus]